jgi:hypothetical protein
MPSLVDGKIEIGDFSYDDRFAAYEVCLKDLPTGVQLLIRVPLRIHQRKSEILCHLLKSFSDISTPAKPESTPEPDHSAARKAPDYALEVTGLAVVDGLRRKLKRLLRRYQDARRRIAELERTLEAFVALAIGSK